MAILLGLRAILRRRGAGVKERAEGCGAGRWGGEGRGQRRERDEGAGDAITAGAGGAGPGGSGAPERARWVRRARPARGSWTAVVTHGLVCRSRAARHRLLPAGQGVPERWENTAALTIVEGKAPWRVLLLTCIAHVEDLGTVPLPGSSAV